MKGFNLFGQIGLKKISVLFFLFCMVLQAFSLGKKDKSTANANQTENQATIQETEQQAESPAPQEVIPDLTLNFKGTDLTSGMEVDQKEFAPAKLTVVNVWGTFCPPCLAEMPDLEKLSKQVMWQRVQVIGVLCDAFAGNSRNVELAKKIIREKNVSYRNFLLDQNTPWLRSVQAVPTTFIVDSKGKVVAEPIVGARSAEEYKAIINAALEKLKK